MRTGRLPNGRTAGARVRLISHGFSHDTKNDEAKRSTLAVHFPRARSSAFAFSIFSLSRQPGSNRNTSAFKNRPKLLTTQHMTLSDRNISPSVAIRVAVRITRVKSARSPIQSPKVQCYIQPIQVKSHD